MNEALATALHDRLKSRGHLIATTVVPLDWIPMDPELDRDAAFYLQKPYTI